MSVLLGNSAGTLQSQATYSTDAGPAGVAIGDVNGDGKVDLVIANQNSNDVSVLLGNGEDLPTAINPGERRWALWDYPCRRKW